MIPSLPAATTFSTEKSNPFHSFFSFVSKTLAPCTGQLFLKLRSDPFLFPFQLPFVPGTFFPVFRLGAPKPQPNFKTPACLEALYRVPLPGLLPSYCRPFGVWEKRDWRDCVPFLPRFLVLAVHFCFVSGVSLAPPPPFHHLLCEEKPSVFFTSF